MGNTLKRAKPHSRIKPNINLSKQFLDSLSFDDCTKSSCDSTTIHADDAILEIDDIDELDDIEVEDDDNISINNVNELKERSNGVKITKLVVEDDDSIINKNKLYKKHKSDTNIHNLRKIPSKHLN